LCEVRLPEGMNENSHIKISRCVVAMVTAINHATLKAIFSAKILPLKTKIIWSGSRVNVNQLKKKIPQGEAPFP